MDRDDDFGRKAGIKSPIIGIKNNIDAANKLGQIDPEDSDVNAIFSAISTYNSLAEEKKKVEIATICGHINVGFKSDEILAEQLEEVIKKTDVKDVVLITDGAEDEYILPIIQSRIKITSIKRVSIKQSKELEDTYYRILKMLDDDKVLKQFVLPIALVLIVWAFFALLGMAGSGFGAILLTLGAYLLIRVFKWERNIAFMWTEIKSGFMTGRLSIWTFTVAAVIIVATGFFAYNNTNFDSNVEFLPVLSFARDMVWGIVIAGLIAMFGRVVDVSVKDKKTPWKYWIAPFSLFAFGFISYAIFNTLHDAIEGGFAITWFFGATFIGYIGVGILIALVGAITYHYIKEMHIIEEKELEIEKQTTSR